MSQLSFVANSDWLSIIEPLFFLHCIQSYMADFDWLSVINQLFKFSLCVKSIKNMQFNKSIFKICSTVKFFFKESCNLTSSFAKSHYFYHNYLIWQTVTDCLSWTPYFFSTAYNLPHEQLCFFCMTLNFFFFSGNVKPHNPQVKHIYHWIEKYFESNYIYLDLMVN